VLRTFKNIRPAERRDTWAAFACLFAVIGSHSVLETARDALFLAEIEPSRLPIVYIAIAVAALVFARLRSRIAAGAGNRGLTLWIGVVAAVTFGFWAFLDAMGDWGLYALYVWSGTLTSLILIQFWTIIGDLFSVTQAKRVYGFIGAGSVMGAIAGSALASALAQTVGDPRELVLASAVGFSCAALTPQLFRASKGGARADEPESSPGLAASVRSIARQDYARSIVTLLFVSTACLTVADYVFKFAVANEVDAAELGMYFANVYLATNVLSLVVQLFLVSYLVRRYDISRALAVLPVLLIAGGASLLVLGGLMPALFVKGADGSLRHSLHRTATELLFVPLTEAVRRRVKAVIDVVGQRGGQALASVGILIGAAVEAPFEVLVVALVALSCVWVAAASSLRRHYLEVFRRRLRGGFAGLSEYPQLDMASLETLIATLDSGNDEEVLAALDVLDREGRVHLVPALILYHPAEEVVLRALELFTLAGRTNAVHVADRLFEHPSPRVRSAAIAARSVLAFDERQLRMRLSLEDDAQVRVTITVNLIASGAIVGSDADESLAAIMRNGSVEARVALAQAIGRRASRGFGEALTSLALAIEPEVRVAGIRAMGRVLDPALLPAVVSALGTETTREIARRTLERFGDPAIDALRDALNDPDFDRYLRWQVPSALTRLNPVAAAQTLLDNLPNETDGMVRYRSIRALEMLSGRHPSLELDADKLDQAIRRTTSRAYRYIDRRSTMVGGIAEVRSRNTPGARLILRMLDDKVDHCVERLLRLLGLANPGEDFSRIRRGLASETGLARASAIELIENVLSPPLRQAVVGLVDDQPDRDRLAGARAYHVPMALDYEGLLRHMLLSGSESVRAMTSFHIAEIGATELIPDLREVATRGDQNGDVALALSALEHRAPEEVRHAP